MKANALGNMTSRVSSLGAFVCVWVLALCVAVCLAPASAQAAESDYPDGTYYAPSMTSSTGMVTLNTSDSTPVVTIGGDTVSLTFDIYNPTKYDATWQGRRSAAPADPLSAQGLMMGSFIAKDAGYAGKTETWVDEQGQVGPAGVEYKSIRFTYTFTKSEFVGLLEDGGTDDVYYVFRRSAWSPSNPLNWMGSSDNFFSLGTLTTADGTPVGPSTDPGQGGSDTPTDPDNPGGGSSDTPSDPSTPSDADKQAAINLAKTLIAKLPHDPYDVTIVDASDVQAAQVAYEALDDASRKVLDSENAMKDGKTYSRSYGRYLEQAVWALNSLTVVDNSTTLADGTYTTGLSSDSNMGKSTSARGFKFTAKSVIVEGGKAMAIIEHGTSSPGTLHIGDKEYTILSTNGKAQFKIPVDLNSTFYFTEKARNATESTDAISYEMYVNINESTAKPDGPVPDDSKEEEPGGQQGGTTPSGDNSGGSNGGSNGNNGGNNGNSNGTANNGNANNSGSRGTTNLAFNENAAQNKTNSNNSDSSSKSAASASAASAKADSNGANSQVKEKTSSSADGTPVAAVTPTSSSGGSGGGSGGWPTALLAAAGLLCALAAGAGGFVTWFRYYEGRSA